MAQAACSTVISMRIRRSGIFSAIRARAWWSRANGRLRASTSEEANKYLLRKPIVRDETCIQARHAGNLFSPCRFMFALRTRYPSFELGCQPGGLIHQAPGA